MHWYDVLIMDTDYHEIYDEEKQLINIDKPISVGESVWIGCRSTILKGSIIPSNCVIAACSIISGELKKDGCIYSSNKKIIKEGICWER